MLKVVLILLGINFTERLLGLLFISRWQREQYAGWGWNKTRLWAAGSFALMWFMSLLSPLSGRRLQPWFLVSYFIGALITTWAVRVNPYFVPAIIKIPEILLVKTGPYKYLRHPGYFGMLIQAASFACIFNTFPVFLGALLYTAVVLWVRHTEDQLLYPQ